MNKYFFIAIILVLVSVICALAASPSYSNLNTNDFTTNTVIGGQISIRANTNTFLTTDATVGLLWGTNAAAGFITNKNYSFGVRADDTTFDINEVIVFGPVSGLTGFRFTTNSFHGVAFNIGSGGDSNSFGTRFPNSSNWFQVGRAADYPINEITLSDLLFWGTNATFKRNITNDVLSPDSPVMSDGSTPPALKSGFPANGQVPNNGYEIAFYEPFSGGSLSVNSAIGRLGWTQADSGVGQGLFTFTNAPNHWGTLLILTSQSANSIKTLYCGQVLNAKPTIPPLNALTGWTNRIIWRMNGTNACKSFIGMQNGDLVLNAVIGNGIGIQFTTNSNNVQGWTSSAGSQTTTNLGVITDGQWYTNEIWSTSAGVISFTKLDGTEATLSATVPSTGLTPAFGIAKHTGATPTNSMEIDEWVIVRTRTP